MTIALSTKMVPLNNTSISFEMLLNGLASDPSALAGAVLSTKIVLPWISKPTIPALRLTDLSQLAMTTIVQQ